jgi:Ca2+-binding EF-hand superfamily protein
MASLTVLFFSMTTITSSLAGHHYHGCHNMTDMTEMDTNQDGLITFDEFSAPHMEKYRSAFRMLDTDNDEVINQDEWDEFLKVHGFKNKDNS